jgi:hypothetical protein
VDQALAEACVGLPERYDITVPALYTQLGGRPLVNDVLNRPWRSDRPGSSMTEDLQIPWLLPEVIVFYER